MVVSTYMYIVYRLVYDTVENICQTQVTGYRLSLSLLFISSFKLVPPHSGPSMIKREVKKGLAKETLHIREQSQEIDCSIPGQTPISPIFVMIVSLTHSVKCHLSPKQT